MSHSNPIITALKRVTAFVPDDFVKETPDWGIRGYRARESIMNAFLAGEKQKLRQMITHGMSVAIISSKCCPNTDRRRSPPTAPRPITDTAYVR